MTKGLIADFMPDLAKLNGITAQKVESFAIYAEGNGFVVTNNGGTSDSKGETMFWSVGAVQ